MTRKESVRTATDNAREGVRHAAEVVAPKMSLAARQAQSAARGQYAAHLAPRIAHARDTLPPAVDLAATRAAHRTRQAARHAGEYTTPRFEAARAAAGPAREEAIARSAAAVAALRGEVTAADVRKITRRRARRARTGRFAKRLLVFGIVAGGAMAAWKWWEKQANPDWLVEPPAATEVGDRSSLASMDGSAPADASALDPEVQAKQAEAEGSEGEERRG